MPSALLRSCTVNGCPNLSEGGPCAECRRARQRAWDARRGSAAARGYGRRWGLTSTRLRRTRLRLCGDRMAGAPETSDSRCRADGLTVPATLVDHIVPVTGPSDPRFWQSTNWQGLCDACHNAKRQREAQAATRGGGGGIEILGALRPGTAGAGTHTRAQVFDQGGAVRKPVGRSDGT